MIETKSSSNSMAQMMRLCIDASHLETIAIKVIKERG